MEKFEKLSRTEMRNVLGGIIGHRVHCVYPACGVDCANDHIVEADICPSDGGWAICIANGFTGIINAYCN